MKRCRVLLFVLIFIIGCKADRAIPQSSVTQRDAAIAIYTDFICGKIEAKTENGTVRITHTMSKDTTVYNMAGECAFFDMNGDGIPELHVRERFYDIYSYYDGELHLWRTGTLYELPLDNRAILHTRYGAAPPNISYTYVVFDFWGNETMAHSFQKGDIDHNDVYDESDDYFFEEIKLSKADWNALTENYLSVASDLITWVPLEGFVANHS